MLYVINVQVCESLYNLGTKAKELPDYIGPDIFLFPDKVECVYTIQYRGCVADLTPNVLLVHSHLSWNLLLHLQACMCLCVL